MAALFPLASSEKITQDAESPHNGGGGQEAGIGLKEIRKRKTCSKLRTEEELE